jgi:hypothetical protein
MQTGNSVAVRPVGDSAFPSLPEREFDASLSTPSSHQSTPAVSATGTWVSSSTGEGCDSDRFDLTLLHEGKISCDQFSFSSRTASHDDSFTEGLLDAGMQTSFRRDLSVRTSPIIERALDVSSKLPIHFGNQPVSGCRDTILQEGFSYESDSVSCVAHDERPCRFETYGSVIPVG